MHIDCHIIQNLAPSSLNRDDTGAPKTSMFGGVRRAAISSQSLKRAIRMYMQHKNLVPPEEQAVRTKRLIFEAAGILESRGRNRDEAILAAETALASIGLNTDEKHQSQYLLFMPKNAPEQMANLVDAHFDVLLAAAEGMTVEAKEDAEGGSGKQKGSKAKKARQQGVNKRLPEEVVAQVQAIFEYKSIVQAAFGRMLADLKMYNIDAFVSVGRAIGTNRLAAEFDYVSVVDDLLADDETGAGFLGVEEYNSACLYKFMTISVSQALKNLGGDRERVRMAIEGLLESFAFAVPSGKRNSFPTWVNPSLLLVVVREDQPLQLCNAFETPVYPTEKKGLIQRSIEALDEYFGDTVTTWNRMKDIRYIGVVKEGPAELKVLGEYREPTLVTLIDKTIAAAL